MNTRILRHGLTALAVTVALAWAVPAAQASEHVMMLPASGFLAADTAEVLQRNSDNNGYVLGEGLGANSTFADVQQLGSVSSTGFDMRSFAAATIRNPLISAGYFYFIEVNLPVGNNTQFLGVRIVHRSTC